MIAAESMSEPMSTDTGNISYEDRTAELCDAISAMQREMESRAEVERQLREAVILLERHSQAKSEFVANVSHELKTPLTSMMYGIRNLLNGIAGPLPDHAVRYLKLFDTECQRLVNTINDILDLGKIENQTLTLAAITSPLGHLVTRSLETMHPQAEAAGITLTVSPDPAVPFVRCDPNMIQRVLQNIIGNAIKFTPRQGTITLATAPDPGNAKFARITVTDTGTGIPPDALSHVTERYFRANIRSSGSGLGLALSKDIIQLHGGTLAIASPPPGQTQGTSVTLTLPLAEAPTVLVGDDDPVIQNLLRQHLATHGYRTLTADSGQEIILAAEVSRPDLILQDLILGDIHGTTVILSLRSSPQIRYTPIIAITGATLDETTAEILSRFAVPTLPKPWKTSELFDVIDTALLGMIAFQPSHVEVKP